MVAWTDSETGGAVLVMRAQEVYGLWLYAGCEAELLEVQRVHVSLLFKADGIGGNLPVAYAQQGTGFDVVEPPVFDEELNGRPGAGALLYLIE